MVIKQDAGERKYWRKPEPRIPIRMSLNKQANENTPYKRLNQNNKAPSEWN